MTHRPDRDDWLIVQKSLVQDIKWRQIEVAKEGEYEPLSLTLPFDYNSIMLYGKYAFVKRNARVSDHFFDATTHLHKRSCLSIYPSVCTSVCPVNDEYGHFLKVVKRHCNQ